MNQMNMNQMGMNQMNMNQMGMNQMNMNQIGMNQIGINNPNQMNSFQMDNTTLNIKNIVQPYEKKIKELEEIIRQKDFEITVLRQKLNMNNPNNNFINIIPNQLMEMPIMNQMMMGNNIQNQEKPMKIKIKSENNEFDIDCFRSDKVSSIHEKYNIKGSLTYYFNVLDEKWSFGENRINFYGSTIHVKQSCINLIFRTVQGNAHWLSFSDDCPLGIALINYIIKCDDPFCLFGIINKKHYSKKIVFLFNAITLKVEDDTPIGTVFKGCANPKIVVSYI